MAGSISSRRVAVESLERRTFLDGTAQTIVIPVGENGLVTFPQAGKEHIDLTFKYAAGSISITGTDLVQTTTRKGLSVSGTILNFNQLLIDQSFSPTRSEITLDAINYPKGSTNWPSLASLDDTVAVNRIRVRHFVLEGSASIDDANYLRIGAVSDSTISGLVSRRMSFGNIMDSKIYDSGPLCDFCCCEDLSSTPDASLISGVAIQRIQVRKDFDADLILSGSSTKKYALKQFSAAEIGGAWNVSGNTHSITTGFVNSPFAGNFYNVDLFNVRENFTGNFNAWSVGTLNIRGNLIGSTMNFTDPYVPGLYDLGHLNVGNYIESTHINADGNINSIHTMYTYYSSIQAGISSSFVFGSTPTPADYTAPCWIKSFYSDCPSMHYEHFIDSYVGATNFGTVHVGNVVTNNYGSPEGFAGYRFDSLSFGLGGVKPHFKNLISQTQFDTDLTKQHVSPTALGDLRITLAYSF